MREHVKFGLLTVLSGISSGYPGAFWPLYSYTFMLFPEEPHFPVGVFPIGVPDSIIMTGRSGPPSVAAFIVHHFRHAKLTFETVH